jgi:NTP pyrophosphatase (non-canonical NTP hydrolase)
MEQIKEEKIAEACLKRWGAKDQIRQTVEECGELIVALSKYGRKVNGSTEKDIRDEIADVEIMCRQMRLLFDSRMIDNIKDYKLLRLVERLATE